MTEAMGVTPGRPCPPHYHHEHEREFEIGLNEAWAAKIDRDYEEFSDRDHRRPWEQAELEARLDSQLADLNAKLDAQNLALNAKLDDRQAKREEDTRARILADAEISRRLSEALWTAHIRQMEDISALKLRLLADAIEAAYVARASMWNIQVSESLRTGLGRDALQGSVLMGKEFMGPPRGGTTPVETPKT